VSASYAVIAAGGRQVRVQPGETVTVDRLPVQAGEQVSFDRVLLVGNGENVRIGTPHVPGALVRGHVLAEERGPKVRVYKKKRRKMYRRTRGHRQWYSVVRIDSIDAEE
jgi:large subunit ribosomal protein L21